MNRTFLSIILFSATAIPSFAQKVFNVESPDKSISVNVTLTKEGNPVYSVTKDGVKVLEESRLGLVREDGSFNKNLKLSSVSRQTSVTDHYELLTGKRRVNDYKASQRIFHLKNAGSELFDIIFQVSNDGVAFRYFFPGNSKDVKKVVEESTS
jgi:hypothetical protein